MHLAISLSATWARRSPSSTKEPKYFPYRSSSRISEFFEDLDTDYRHDGSTRNRWVAEVVEQMLAEPHDGQTHPPELFCRLIDQLMDPRDGRLQATRAEICEARPFTCVKSPWADCPP
jgi:hypothetical protein